MWWRRRSVGQIMWEMKTCYTELRRQGLSCTQYNTERLYRNCLPKHITEETMAGRIEVTGRQGRRSWQLLDYHTEMRGYWKLKEEALDHTLWRTRFGRDCGPAIRQTPEWMNFKQPTIKDNQMRPEVLMMIMMKNTGFWEVPLIFLRKTHQYVAKFLPYNMMSHTEKWDSSSAIRHFSAWITLHCYKCLHPRVHHTGCPENLGFHNTVAFNTLTNVKTEARDVQSPANKHWKYITGTSCMATDVSVLN